MDQALVKALSVDSAGQDNRLVTCQAFCASCESTSFLLIRSAFFSSHLRTCTFLKGRFLFSLGCPAYIVRCIIAWECCLVRGMFCDAVFRRVVRCDDSLGF